MVRVSPSGDSGGGSDGGSSGVDDVSVNLVSSGEGFAFDPEIGETIAEDGADA